MTVPAGSQLTTYMLTLAILGFALSTTRIILMLKMQWLKMCVQKIKDSYVTEWLLKYCHIELKMYISVDLLGFYLLEDWWLSFVQAVCRFLFPMVNSL